jgi:hypothetical protein
MLDPFRKLPLKIQGVVMDQGGYEEALCAFKSVNQMHIETIGRSPKLIGSFPEQ